MENFVAMTSQKGKLRIKPVLVCDDTHRPIQTSDLGPCAGRVDEDLQTLQCTWWDGHLSGGSWGWPCAARMQLKPFIDGSKTSSNSANCGKEDTFEVPDGLPFPLSGAACGHLPNCICSSSFVKTKVRFVDKDLEH
jgi:hypothetical protein